MRQDIDLGQHMTACVAQRQTGDAGGIQIEGRRERADDVHRSAVGHLDHQVGRTRIRAQPQRQPRQGLLRVHG